MPKAPRLPHEIEAVREEILDTALELIIEDGFNNLSMRRIAAKLGITATTIYNYVTGKDELNLMIRMRGFGMLYERLEKGYGEHTGLVERLEAMIHGYVDFGITYPAYYDIMFNLTTPKYTDYIGTDMEPAALREKETALRCFEIFNRLIAEYTAQNNIIVDGDFIGYTITKMWSDLHGIISLFNSRVLFEVNEGSRSVLDRRVADVIAAAAYLREILESAGAGNK